MKMVVPAGLLCICLVGCVHDIWSWDDIVIDPLNQNYGSFQLDPTCQRTGPLDLEIGYGESAFTSLPDGHQFKVYYGPQGGSHVYGALRVNDPALDFPHLEVVFRLVDDDACASKNGGGVFGGEDKSPAWARRDDSKRAGCAPRLVGFRHGVLGPKLKTSASGAVEEAGITVFHDDYGGGGADRITLSVRDPCGRSASVERQATD